jgi:wyosine [tRNA(Phe)-imidazoG37] synthetase (radical SAM superfamily)
MNKTIYGPIPSRRLGKSLGISPIPKKTCNYACVYCMLGPTKTMVTEPEMFFEVDMILNELKDFIDSGIPYDVVSIVGDGEPTLYEGLSKLMDGIKALTSKPIAIITNGATMDDPKVYQTLLKADILLPSVNGYDLASFKKINRPFKAIDFDSITQALERFSKEFQGEMWLELMLIKDFNDSDEDLAKYKEFFKQFTYDRLYLNTPIRIPTEDFVQPITHQRMEHAMEVLDAIGIEDVYTNGFVSSIEDNMEAILSLIKRHPMHQHEITHFLKTRKCLDMESIFNQLEANPKVEKINYHGYRNYRI